MAGIKECTETRTTMQEGHEADDMTLGKQEGKDDNDDEQEGVNEPDDEFEEQTITDEDYMYNLVVKNDHDEESCRKCTQKIKNGVRCKSCKRAFHSGRCSGLTQEQIKNEAAKENVWICGMCKHPNKNCPCCRDKDKEIKNLKKLVTELESSYEKINEDFAVCNERYSNLEDRLYREKKLRKTVERELRELEDSVKMDDKCEWDGSCSDYSDSSSSSSEEECKPKSKAKRSHRKPCEKINRGSQERSRDKGEKWKRSVTSKVVPSDERQRSRSPRHERKSDEYRHVDVRSPTRSSKQEHQEEETNMHYERAARYLKEHCNERIVQYEGDNWRRSESETETDRQVQDAEVGLEEVSDKEEIVLQPPPRVADKGKKICYEFKSKGACLTQGCKFLHFNPNLSYPSFTGKTPDESSPYSRGHGQPKGRGSRSRPDGRFPDGYQKSVPYTPKHRSNVPPKPNRTNFRKNITFKKECFQFKQTGNCRFGNNCKFYHNMSSVYSGNNLAPTSPFLSNSLNRPSNVRNEADVLHNSFLREMRNILMSFRDNQRQGQLVPQVGQNSYQPVISTTRSVPPMSQEQHFWPM